jgi:hypothetical protein
MTTNFRQREWSSGLLYFLAGSIASTGINIVTSLATGNERGADALLLLASSIGFVCVGYILSLAGGIASDFEESKAANRLHELSDEEQTEILSELGTQRGVQLKRLRLALIIGTLLAFAPIATRETALHRRAFAVELDSTGRGCADHCASVKTAPENCVQGRVTSAETAAC